MKSILFVKWSTLIISLLILVGLSSGLVSAHTNLFETDLSPANNTAAGASDCRNVFPFSSQADAGPALVQDMADWFSTFTSAITPTGDIDLVMNGPTAVATGDVFSVTVVAQHVPDPGLYGVQFEINFNPTLISLSNPQPNPDLSFVVRNVVSNTLGKLTFVASRQGNVPGLTGDVTLLTFDVTAGNTPCMPTLSFGNVKIGDAQANPFNVTPQNYTFSVGILPTPTSGTPTITPTATSTVTPTVTITPTNTPTSTPTVTVTPTVTITPTSTPTSTVTVTPTVTITPSVTTTPTLTATPTPTATGTVTVTVTATPPTDTPTPTPTPTSTPTSTVTTTPTVTVTVTATPPTDTPTPTPTSTPTATVTVTPTVTPTITPGPGAATVSGQVILSGRANNDWSGAIVQLDNSPILSATTNTTGNFSITNVATGTHTSASADAPGYLPAVCNSPVVTAPLTTLASIALLSGDVNNDNVVNILDGTAVGVSFGAIGSGLAEDINQDGEVDIFDIILVSVNFGVSGPQAWVCQ